MLNIKYICILVIVCRIIAPKDIHVLISGTCQCHFIWQRELFRCHQVKGLEMGDYPGLSGWAPYDPKSP